MKSSYQRGRWEGVTNIVRFNWHFYLVALVILLLAILLTRLSIISAVLKLPVEIGVGVIIFYLVGSLVISHFIYDRSELYQLKWLKQVVLASHGNFVNIHSGFDETSLLLKQYFPEAKWNILDFYDPNVHTEVSIARARKYRPILPETIAVQTTSWNLNSTSVSAIFGFLAIHEIRSVEEKIAFFKEAHRILQVDGKFILIEHLRDRNNLLAYGPGCLHFFSEKVWKNVFHTANFEIERQFRITPFINVFVLIKQ